MKKEVELACPLRGFAQCMYEKCAAWKGECRYFASVQLTAQLTANNVPEPELEKNVNEDTAIVVVKNAVQTKNKNIRAICSLTGEQEEQIVIARGSAGAKLLDSVGKTVKVTYNVMSDGKAWFCLTAKDPSESKKDKKNKFDLIYKAI